MKKNTLINLAIIMDGNGRWAKAKNLPRTAGHEKGAETIREITQFCSNHPTIQTLTLYAFSTENWKRPKLEVDFLMKLLEKYLKTELKTYHKFGIKFETIGDLSKISPKLQKQIKTTKEETKNHANLTQILALNYGARDEIVRAVKKVLDKNEPISEDNISNALDTPFYDIDLLIRTSGEQRLSNFLLWQASYSELYFTPTLWPDFNAKELESIIEQYYEIDRKFGRTLMISLSVFILGAIIGSFLNVVIYRIPLEQNIAFPASHCPSCKTPLKWWHNIPVFSWVFLGRKCAFCKSKISARYPLIEIITGLLFVAIYYKVGLTWYLPFIFFSFASLLALSMIDFDYMAVPDSVNFASLLFALVTPEFFSAITNAAIAAFGLFAISWFSSKIAKKETMGEADVIVAATMGALLGFPLFFIAIFLSALLAMIPSLIYRDKGVPFVPFLALATFIVYIFDKEAYKLIEVIMHG